MEQKAGKTAGRAATAPVNIAVGQRRVCFTEPAEEERRTGPGGSQLQTKLQPLNTVLAGAGAGSGAGAGAVTRHDDQVFCLRSDSLTPLFNPQCILRTSLC